MIKCGRKYHVVYTPGLGDQNPLNTHLAQLLPAWWKRFGVQAHIIAPHWEEGKEFLPKLQQILDCIDSLVEAEHAVFLIGQSAGGSAAMNAFALRKDVVLAVVNVTGRLRQGEGLWPPLGLAARGSPAFAQSVVLFENTYESTLTERDRARVMTVRPIWDEVVPVATVGVRGAVNMTIPVPEHSIGGIFACTAYAGMIFKFFDSHAPASQT